MFVASLIAAAVLASPALATISITQPIASTQWTAGQQQTITWMDNGQSPDLKSFGVSSVGIWAGNAIQQTQLQLIVDNVDVSTTGSISFVPDPSIGPNSGVYFIRFTSASLKDPSNPTYPAEAFSAKFTLSGMSGTFNSTVQAQIDAASSAPVGGSTSAAASSTPAGGSSSHSTAPTSSGSSSTKPTGSSSKSASPSATGAAQNGASGVAASVGIVGTIVAMASAMLF